MIDNRPVRTAPRSLTLLLAFGFAIYVFANTAAAQDEKAQLPVTKVVLFSSGVGYFEHNGQVDGDASVELKFNISDINDLLKSLVLQDLDGGKISTVTYASKDPVTKTLRTFAIDLTSEPTLAAILQQVRGEQIEIQTTKTLTGKIVGIEFREVPVGDDKTIRKDFLNLLTESGFESIAWDTITSFKLVDKQLNAELQQALELLALSHATDKKAVTLQFLGSGKRNVRVGYVQESPIWKTSYRLVLNDKDQALLQGWAIVENPTEDDWSKVDLTLVSGRPISFIMDLYQPLYAQRPVVVPELFASLIPRTYNQDLAGEEADLANAARPERLGRHRSGSMPGMGSMGGMGGMGMGGMMPGAAPGYTIGKPVYESTENAPAQTPAALDPRQGVQSMAQSGDVGELFRYTIDTPVTLARQQSAMLPIVNDTVEGKKLSIYNPSVHAKHPLNGLKLKNSTDLHLLQGPITVFDGGAYAGDARIEDLQPGTERLISYALDLEVEVAPENDAERNQMVSVAILHGNLLITHKHVRTHKYVLKNSSSDAKSVLIEQPFSADWTLVTPEKPTEKTRDLYRFAVDVEPGKAANFDVVEERIAAQTIALSNLNDDTIVFYSRSTVATPEVKEKLAELVRLNGALKRQTEETSALLAKIQVIEQEQTRIRQNMDQLDRTSDLYNRYVKKFGEQEDEVESTRQALEESQKKLNAAREQLDAFLGDHIEPPASAASPTDAPSPPADADPFSAP